jgi:hypothetical protein
MERWALHRKLMVKIKMLQQLSLRSPAVAVEYFHAPLSYTCSS